MNNFSFFKKKWIHFYEFGETAERNLYRDPNITMYKMRQLAEGITNEILRYNNKEKLRSEKLSNKIEFLFENKIIDIKLYKYLEEIRITGNVAVHENHAEFQDAKNLLELGWRISVWFIQKYSTDEIKAPYQYNISTESIDLKEERNKKSLRTIVSCSDSTFINGLGEVVHVLNIMNLKFVSNFTDGLALFCVSKNYNSYYGFLNEQFEVQIEPLYKLASHFGEGLAPIMVENENYEDKWGYINSRGQVVIKPTFDDARKFQEGVASVKVGEKWGYINKSGQFIIQPQYEDADIFKDGLAKIRKGYLFGFINKNNKLIIPAIYLDISYFNNGLATIVTSSDENDKKDIQQYQSEFLKKEEANNIDDESYQYFQKRYIDRNTIQFNKGTWMKNKVTNNIVINQKGEVVYKPPSHYSIDGYVSEGLLAVKIDGKYGYLDESFQLAIPPKYNMAGQFSCGLARVSVSENGYNEMGFINKNGDFVINPIYRFPSDFTTLKEARAGFNTEARAINIDDYDDNLGYYEKIEMQEQAEIDEIMSKEEYEEF